MFKRKKIIFLAEGASLAHIVRPLVLAKHLDPERFEISFACADWYKWMIDQSGFKYYPLPTITAEEFRQRISSGRPLYDQDRLQQYVEAETHLFKNLSPDLVVGDFRISLSISTEIYHIPYIAIANAYWSPYSTQKRILPDLPIGRLLGRRMGQLLFSATYPLASILSHAKGFNQLREFYNLSVSKSLEGVYTEGEWTMYADIPSLAPTEHLPGHHQYMGPILEMPQIPFPEWWQQWPKNNPVIYVSLGSTGDLSMLESIIKSLDRSDVTVILATAQRIERKQWPKNFYVAAYLPGLEVCQNSDLVLFNGGAGSLYQSLSCGCPVLGFPSNMDQFLCSSFVQAQKAGKMISSDQATVKRIHTDIDEILSEHAYRKGAETLAEEIKQYDAVRNFKAFIDLWDQGKLKRRL